VLETVPRQEEKKRERVGCVQPTPALSGTPDCTVSQRRQQPTVGHAINARHVVRANSRLGTPDCPVCTGQCPARQPIPRTNGRMRQIWKENAHRTATVTVQWCTGLSGVHWTVSGAPTDPEDQRSDAPDMERERAPNCYSDCPVVPRTVRCTTRQKARNAFQTDLQRLLAALGL
jgi:hypothetical protein